MRQGRRALAWPLPAKANTHGHAPRAPLLPARRGGPHARGVVGLEAPQVRVHVERDVIVAGLFSRAVGEGVAAQPKRLQQVGGGHGGRQAARCLDAVISLLRPGTVTLLVAAECESCGGAGCLSLQAKGPERGGHRRAAGVHGGRSIACMPAPWRQPRGAGPSTSGSSVHLRSTHCSQR